MSKHVRNLTLILMYLSQQTYSLNFQQPFNIKTPSVEIWQRINNICADTIKYNNQLTVIVASKRKSFLEDVYLSTEIFTSPIIFHYIEIRNNSSFPSNGLQEVRAISKSSMFVLLIDTFVSLNYVFSEAEHLPYWTTRARFVVIAALNRTPEETNLREMFTMFLEAQILNIVTILPKRGCSATRNASKEDDKEHDCLDVFTYIPSCSTGGKILEKIPSANLKILQRGIGLDTNNYFPEESTSIHCYPVHVSNFNRREYLARNENGSFSIILEPLKSTVNYMKLTPWPIRKQRRVLNKNILDKQGNNTWSQTVGEVADSQSDICSYPITVTLKRYEIVDFTIPHWFFNFHFVVPKAHRIPQWLSCFLPFETKLWVEISGVFLIISISEYMSRYIIAKMNLCNFPNLMACVLYMLSVSLQISVPRKPNHFILRLIFFFVIVNFFIINMLYDSSLIGFMITPTYHKDLSSFQDITESGLPIIALPQFVSRISDVSDSKFRTISARTRPTQNMTEAIAHAVNERNVIIFDITPGAHLLVNRYNLPDKTPIFHIAEESVGLAYAAYPVSKTFPYLQRINQILNRLIENGLTERWLTDYLNKLEGTFNKEIQSIVTALSLFHFQAVFAIFLSGACFSLIFFFTEYITFKYKKYVARRKANTQ